MKKIKSVELLPVADRAQCILIIKCKKDGILPAHQQQMNRKLAAYLKKLIEKDNNLL